MTNLPPSSSDSSGFHSLDPRIQRWIWSAGWTDLREAQEQAIPLILGGDEDVIIAASTASGKTEAAFLPILTRLAAEEGSVALYISPLKALINDQWKRLEELADLLEIPVTPWHGDITQTRKTRFLKTPKGCLLITPESLEAMLIRQGHGLRGILAGLRYVVIDELHAFMGTERGKQLQSLLHRVEKALGRKVRRVGLSATLGDMLGAAHFLRPERGEAVSLIVTKEEGTELKVLVKGMLEPVAPPSPTKAKAEESESQAKLAVVDHMFQTLRGSNNLVFPNSRSEVEYFSDRLRRRCEVERYPNEFWPHHGSLSKDIREETEAALKQKERPATAICTSTLELGIDIGSVKSVVQVGPSPSVASLRQRLGRSGRRKGEPAILRAYAIESQLTSHSGLSDLLREGLVQSIAMIRLLVSGWYESASSDGLHASTLIQQLLSSLAQHGGLQAGQAWELLCGAGAPFASVTRPWFIALLRRLGEEEIIFQDPTGLLLLAPKGEQITQHYTFYATFSTDEEYRIVTQGRTLGSMPVSRPLTPGSFLIFAGRRWQVLSLSQEDLVIEVTPAAAGTIPGFTGGSGAMVHDRVREEMRLVMRNQAPIPFLDERAQTMLREARENYVRLDLDSQWIRQDGKQTQILLWKGDRVQDTLLLMLQAHGYKGTNEGLFISLEDTTPNQVLSALSSLQASQSMAPDVLAQTVKNPFREKWDPLLPEVLLHANFASSYLDIDGVRSALKPLLVAI